MGTKLNKKGFSALEILIVLIVILVLGLGGWYVYKNNKKDNKTSTTTSISNKSIAAPLDVYSGWKTYTSPNEKSSFKYPQSWALKSETYPANTPGSDYGPNPLDEATLTSPSGLILSYVSQGTGGTPNCMDKPLIKISKVIKLKALSDTYIVEVENSSNNLISIGLLDQSFNNFYPQVDFLNMTTSTCSIQYLIVNRNSVTNTNYPNSWSQFYIYINQSPNDSKLTSISSSDQTTIENILGSYTY